MRNNLVTVKTIFEISCLEQCSLLRCVESSLRLQVMFIHEIPKEAKGSFAKKTSHGSTNLERYIIMMKLS